MNLSQDQKKFIKKNYKILSPEKISEEMNLREADVKKYIAKKYGKINSLDTNFKENNNHTYTHNIDIKKLIKTKWYIFLTLLILIAISYTNSIGNAFVSDDIAGIAKNPNIGNLQFLLNNPRDLINSLTHFFIFKINGLNPAGFRLYNILLHLSSVFLIYIIFLYLTSKSTLSFIGAAIFAVHPLLIEAVGWISGRPYTQYTFFLLLAFYLYISTKNSIKNYLFSILFFIFAVLSSEKAIIFPLIIFTYDFSFGKIRENWKKISGFFLLLILGGIYFASQIASRAASVLAQSAGSAGQMLNPLTQIPIAVTSYLQLIFWPIGLTLYHSEMIFSQNNYLFRLGIFIIFITLIIISFKRNKLIFFFLSLFLISLFPTLTPFGISWIVAERYVYFGAIGIFFVVAYFFDRIFEKENVKNIAEFVFALILFILIVLTIFRNIEWKNEDNLWVATLRTSPSSQNSHNNMGDVYARHGDLQNAELEFKKALEINPRYSEAWHNLALTYQNENSTESAIMAYKQAVKFNPNLWQSLENLTVIYFNEKRYDEAKNNLLKLIYINPKNANYYINLAYVENRMGDKKQAIKYLQLALSIDPNNKNAKLGLGELNKEAPLKHL